MIKKIFFLFILLCMTLSFAYSSEQGSFRILTDDTRISDPLMPFLIQESTANPAFRFTMQKKSSDELKEFTPGEEPFLILTTTLPEKRDGLRVEPFALSGLLLAVNTGNSIGSLEKDEVLDIFKGKITHWNTSKNREKPPALHLYQTGEGNPFEEYESKVLPDEPEGKRPLRFITGAPDKSIAFTSDDLYAIAVLPLTFFTKKEVKFLKINGVRPTIEEAEKGNYPFSKKIYLVIPEKKHPLVIRFAEQLKSRNYAKLLLDNGIIPLTQIKKTGVKLP